MEQQNHELLGLIVARQQAVCKKLLAEEKKQEDKVTRRHAGFLDTCVPHLWENVRDIIVPHYHDEMRVLTMPVGRFGGYIRCNDIIVGIRVRRYGGGTASWRCKLNKDGQLKYVGDLVYINDSLECNVPLTKQQFTQSFIAHLAEIIPTDKLAHIEPVGFTEKKGRRRVMVAAE